MPNVAPASSTMGGNLQDRKGQAATPMDQGPAGIPMTSQVISSAGSQMTSGIHTSPASMTTGSADGTSNAPYGE